MISNNILKRLLLILCLMPFIAYSRMADPSSRIAGSIQIQAGSQNERYYQVTRIVDGDTFWIDDGSEAGQKIRLIGVDAPESRNSGNKVKAYFGEEAKKYLADFIGGKRVRLEYDVDRFDQYGRTLAYVFLEDGTLVNATLLKNGYAMVMTVPPNVKYADDFLKLSQKARKQQKGLYRRGK